MAKVFYIPYAKFEIHSEFSQEELIAKIRNRISNHDIFGELTAKNKGQFSGSINLTPGEFQIRKRLNYRYGFNATIRRRVVKMDTGSKVKITLKLPTIVYIFLVFSCIYWSLMGSSIINSFEDIIGGLAFAYFITFLWYPKLLHSLYELV